MRLKKIKTAATTSTYRVRVVAPDGTTQWLPAPGQTADQETSSPKSRRKPRPDEGESSSHGNESFAA